MSQEALRFPSPKFFRNLGLSTLVFTSVGLEACSTPTSVPPREHTVASDLPTAKELSPTERLFNVVHGLPASPIKDLLIQRVLPYYQTPPPTEINRGGVLFQVVNPRLEFWQGKPVGDFSDWGIRGRFSERSLGYSVPIAPLFPQKTEVVYIPAVGLLPKSEKRTFPEELMASDGTPLFKITFQPDKPLSSYTAPAITIIRTNPKYKQDGIDAYETETDLVLLKEACSSLIFDIQLEEIAWKMKALNLPTHLLLRDSNGTVKSTEIITPALNAINHILGRQTAAQDLAAVLVVFKATEGTDMMAKIIPSDGANYTAAQMMKNIQLGNDAQSILYSSLQIAILSTEVQEIGHTGDINNFNLLVTP